MPATTGQACTRCAGGQQKESSGHSGKDFNQLDCCIVTTISGGTNGIGGSIACLCHWESPKSNSANIKPANLRRIKPGNKNDDSTFCNCYVLCGAGLACAVSVCANVSGQAHPLLYALSPWWHHGHSRAIVRCEDV